MIFLVENLLRRKNRCQISRGPLNLAPMANATPNHVGRFWQRLDNDRIVCQLCPRDCRLAPGQRGFCFVRQNIGGEMVLTTYGRSSGFCIDPVEKKPLNHFYPGSSILSFGTAGCNLGCKFCQNWSISKSKEFDLLADEASPEEIARAAQQYGCSSVAFTYNDPVIFAEYAMDVADACRALGIHPVAKTAGYMTDLSRPEFFNHMDAANVDLKAFREEFYQKVTLSSLQPVLDTLLYLRHETKVWLEITNLLIPGENDSDAELNAMTEWIAKNLGADVPLHFSAFHPDFRMLDKPSTPAATLKRARNIALSKGLHFVYTGNIHDREGASTYCPHCEKLLIERDWYELGEYHLVNHNQCEYCKGICPGHFAAKPGNWGARRVAVRLHKN